MHPRSGMIRWFGATWNAPLCTPEAKQDTPIGAVCPSCGSPIKPEQRGVTLPKGEGAADSYHLACIRYQLGCYYVHPTGYDEIPDATVETTNGEEKEDRER